MFNNDIRYEELFNKLREIQRLKREVAFLSEEINLFEGNYYGTDQYTPNVIRRYFSMYDYMDPEEYWNSSSATC